MNFAFLFCDQILFTAASFWSSQTTSNPVKAQFKLLFSMSCPSITCCVYCLIFVQLFHMPLWNKTQNMVFIKRRLLVYNILQGFVTVLRFFRFPPNPIWQYFPQSDRSLIMKPTWLFPHQVRRYLTVLIHRNNKHPWPGLWYETRSIKHNCSTHKPSVYE